MYSEKMSEEMKEEKLRSGSSSPTANSHSVSNILDTVYQSQYPSALMAAISASLNPFYSAPDTEHSETPPMSASSSSSPNPSPNLKKKGLSDVINKLHKAASNQTTPSKSGDESTENEDSDSQINENESNSEAKLNKSQQKLLDLLTKANLTQYFGSFIEQGGDDVDQLCDANDLEFKEICDLVGMSSKPLHVKRLKKTIDEFKKSKQPSDLVKAEANYSVQKFLPENSLSLNLPTPHSSCSSVSSTASNPSFSISKLFNRSSGSPVQGLLTTSQLMPIYPTGALNLSKSDEAKKTEIESEDEENMEDYADTDDVEDEDDEEEPEDPKPQTQSSSIKIEQNEKMIKKNKVIELYTKGERCVRKLSQLTGVPLTTVYRVIGKLKGINYNIPRGNGAGRKTILDSQDREILVEILNKQPRISRKALGKELEKLTGKSIHNSTLNRELCRLRYQNSNGQSQQDSYVKNLKKPKKFDELNEECMRMICAETKRFGSQMSQSEFECKPLSGSLSPSLSKQIIEICQMSTNLSQNSSQQLQQLKLEKIKQAIDELLSLGDSFYDKCLNETSIQLCLQKPTLLTRHEDLLSYAKKILENLQIFDDLKSKLKRTAVSNLELQQTQKKAKIEEPLSVQNPFNFYTAALALHLQQGQNFDFNSYLTKLRMNLYQSQQDSLRTLIEKNDSEMKINLKKQEELRVKLFGLSMTSQNNEQLRPMYESLQSQLGELIKQHAHLLSEQARLKSHDMSSQSDIRNLSESDDANSQTNDVNENIDILK